MERSRASYIARTLTSIGAGLARVAASLLFVYLSKCLVDIATLSSGKSLGVYAVLMALTMLLQVLLGSFSSYWESYNRAKTRIDIQRKTFGKVLSGCWTLGRKDTLRSGDVTSRLTEDVSVVTDLLCVRLPDMVTTLCQLVAASVYLMTLEKRLLWLLVGFMIIAVGGSKMFFRTLRSLSDDIRRREADLQQHIQENTLNRILALTLAGVRRILTKFDIIQADILALNVKRLNYNAFSRTLMSLGFSAGYAAAFFWGVFGIRNGSVTFGMMTAFLQLVGQVQRPIAEIGRNIPAIIKALSSYSRLQEVYNLPQEEVGENIVFDSAPSIRVSALSFGYDEEEPVFEGFDYEFEAGEFTAVVGPTGRGKSTLVRLIMSVLKPAEGSVSFVCGERVIASSPSVRCNFLYVPQGNTLLSGSVRENLLLANPHASEEEISEALHTAVADFVYDLPDALDTVCGEMGDALSEGQAQRIAIARALLHPGSVLILDEATSALDASTEGLLLERLISSNKGRRTILFVSHSAAVCSMADRILDLT